MLKAVHHVQVSIPIGSENEARAFYCGVLGMNEVPKPESLAGRGGFWLELGDLQIHFGTEDGIDRSRSKSHIAYLTTDLIDWRDRLTAAGREIVDGIPIPHYRRFEFRDPFGNRIEFLERADQITNNYAEAS
jgi:catechol 2,3-dioxygenase-like lactoylglutathione lyase family enzyme